MLRHTQDDMIGIANYAIPKQPLQFASLYNSQQDVFAMVMQQHLSMVQISTEEDFVLLDAMNPLAAILEQDDLIKPMNVTMERSLGKMPVSCCAIASTRGLAMVVLEKSKMLLFDLEGQEEGDDEQQRQSEEQ